MNLAAIFATATGTDTGKTFVTAGLIRHLRALGRSSEAIKPIMSGFDPANAKNSDAGILLTALGRAVTDENIARISPWRFSAPLSPDMAASREGRTIDLDTLIGHSRAAIASTKADVFFIEGIGGVMVPLDDRHTVADWMAALKVPVLLVAGSHLGTISHTLTCLDVLARRDLEIAAIAVSETMESTVPLDETVDAIARFAGATPTIGIPRLAADAFMNPAFSKLASLF